MTWVHVLAPKRGLKCEFWLPRHSSQSLPPRRHLSIGFSYQEGTVVSFSYQKGTYACVLAPIILKWGLLLPTGHLSEVWIQGRHCFWTPRENFGTLWPTIYHLSMCFGSQKGTWEWVPRHFSLSLAPRGHVSVGFGYLEGTFTHSSNPKRAL